MKKVFALLLLLAFSLPGCEKDDICDADTNTTPRLVIEFYDQADRGTPKTVSALQVIADGQDTPIILNANGTGDARYVSNTSKVLVPLPTDADSVRYSFTINTGNATFENSDTLQINYSRNTVFVSRACGYSLFFALMDTPETGPYLLNDGAPDSTDAWIKDVDVATYNLTTENETHLKIYF